MYNIIKKKIVCSIFKDTGFSQDEELNLGVGEGWGGGGGAAVLKYLTII